MNIIFKKNVPPLIWLDILIMSINIIGLGSRHWHDIFMLSLSILTCKSLLYVYYKLF